MLTPVDFEDGVLERVLQLLSETLFEGLFESKAGLVFLLLRFVHVFVLDGGVLGLYLLSLDADVVVLP